jgi:hypothetical protein
MKFILEKHSTILALAVAVSLTAALSARAQLVATDSINYNAGAYIIGQASGSPNWVTMAASGNGLAGGNWSSKSDVGGGYTGTGANPGSTIVSGSLHYTDGSGNVLITSGNSLSVVTTSGTTAQPELITTSTFGALGVANTAAPGTLWVSYLWQGLNTTGNTLGATTGLYRQATVTFATGGTSATASSGSERLDVGMPNITAANQGTVNPNISLWTAGGSLPNTFSSTAPQQSTVAANNGQTDFILMEFVLDNSSTTADTVNVWINPTLTGTTPVGSPNLTYAAQDFTAVNTIRIASQSTNTTEGNFSGQQFDELNIGDTVASVEPVPEPVTLTLAGLGGLALLGLKRKLA